jgi:hypothetical protein
MADGQVRETRDDENLARTNGWRASLLSVGRSIVMAALVPICLLLMKGILGLIFHLIKLAQAPAQ